MKTVIVTGAGSGIGRATVHRLVADGFAVIATDLNKLPLEETRELCSNPDSISTLVQDVTTPGAPEEAVEKAFNLFGRLDGLINNAGIGGSFPLHDTTDEQYDRVMAVLLQAVFRYSRAAIRRIERPGGVIVQIASVFGVMGSAGSASYSAAKAGVIGLTRQMAADYGPIGIRVNAIAPGVIETGLTKSRIDNERFKRVMIDTTPWPRIGRPEDIAGAISFLCSPSAEFVNGHVLVVDGGWSSANYVPQ